MELIIQECLLLPYSCRRHCLHHRAVLTLTFLLFALSHTGSVWKDDSLDISADARVVIYVCWSDVTLRSDLEFPLAGKSGMALSNHSKALTAVSFQLFLLDFLSNGLCKQLIMCVLTTIYTTFFELLQSLPWWLPERQQKHNFVSLASFHLWSTPHSY